MFRVFATFLKKGSAKNFPTGKVLGYFQKNFARRLLSIVGRFCFNYAIGVCGLDFDVIVPEFGCRHCRSSLRQQIYNASVVERSDLMKGSLREGAPDGVGWRSTRAV